MKFAIAAALLASSAVLTESIRNGKAKKCRKGRGKDKCDNADYSSVYTMTNQPINEILVYSRNPCNGTLAFETAVATNGTGSILSGSNGDGVDLPRPVDDPLASTGSIITAADCLLAVNAGSNDISTFHIVSPAIIELVETYSSDGDFPVSLAEREGMLDLSLACIYLFLFLCTELTLRMCTILPNRTRVRLECRWKWIYAGIPSHTGNL
mmetsp:Transcript_30269/g.45790  ORF Transcript_30269/g.45790 Transcript_30269/m.45790 type:complete len:210 (-) Transcript_30269:205-834(-)